MDIATVLLALASLGSAAALFLLECAHKKSLALSLWASARPCQGAAWLPLYVRASRVVPQAMAIPPGHVDAVRRRPASSCAHAG